MTQLDCPFRFDERKNEEGVWATCGLLQNLMQVDDESSCRVPIEACEACVGSKPVASSFDGSIFPSILNQACEHWSARNSDASDSTKQRIGKLYQISEHAIVDETTVVERQLVSCDAVVYCETDDAGIHAAIDSLIQQTDATVYIHVVIGNSASETLTEKLAVAFDSLWNVQLHRLNDCRDLFTAIQQLAPQLRSEFIAFQHAGAISLPNRIVTTIKEMRRTGRDLAGSALSTLDGQISAMKPSDVYASNLPWPTLVIRRSCFIDLGGFAERENDQAVELVYRAFHSQYLVHMMPFPVVQMRTEWSRPVLGPAPAYDKRNRSLRHHAIGYEQEHINADVVLPIYGQLEFVREAIESILHQEGAETIVHLVDDCGPESTDELFRYWRTHPRVRLYRNLKNIGQYASFNNVSEFAETDLLSVHDGDDISLPHRISVAGNLLRHCDAEFFAATMEQFGDEAMSEYFTDANRFRHSFHPYGYLVGHFAMNPTTCFKVQTFRRLGGYSNFGDIPANKAGLDSEFAMRAYYSGVRFAFSTTVVARHRVHAQAATRNDQTGFGTPRRQFALDECVRRASLFRNKSFDPKAYGAIRRYRGITERIN